ncbi:hypothetical protein BaRGS_00033029, partial [Batillaria attramentaria]
TTAAPDSTMRDHDTDRKSPERRFENPAKFREEQRWFSSAFLRPGDVRADPRLESDNMAVPLKNWPDFVGKALMDGSVQATLCGSWTG